MSDTIENRSGGADLNAGHDITIGGDVVGRDKIVSNIYLGDQQYDVHGLANPYLGLQSFTYGDHVKYAGREKLIAETVARLTAPDEPLALLFITGASGSGKSSFVQAGVLPALEKHYAALNVKWAVFRPSRDPLTALADALWRQLGLPQFDAHTTSPEAFNDFLKTNTPPQQVNVIVIDQFEELFTQSAAQPRDALFNLLTQLPPFRVTRTHIIATVRADYLPELFALPVLYDIAKRGIDLRAMSVDELREAIQQPLRAAYPDKDKRFQDELVERLAHDSAEDAAYLPLLQVTLEEIWRKGTLTIGSYINLADAIKQRADKVLAYQDYDAAQPNQPRPPEEQAAILNLCLALVDVSLDDEARRDVRRRRSKAELISGAPERTRLIDTLAQARLLSVGTESGEPARVEVDLIHETLLSNWDRLRQAITERRHELRQRVRFEQQLKEWIGQNRSDDYLLSGVRLAEAHELERRNDIAMHNGDAKDFVRRSVEREEARRQKEIKNARRRATIFFIVAAVALVAAVIALFFGDQSSRNANLAEHNAATAQAASTKSVAEASSRATAEANALTQRDEARQQSQLSLSRELAAVAISELDVDPERSILVALEANNVLRTYEAEDALRRALSASQIITQLRGHEGGVIDAQFSPDGQWIVTAGGDKTARVWEAATGKEVTILRGHEDIILCAQFSPDGKQILTSSPDGTVRVWDAATGKEIAKLPQYKRSHLNAQFSPNGQWIVTAGEDETTVTVWDAATDKEVARLRGHEKEISDVQFSPNGLWIVTASSDKTARVWETATGKEVVTLLGHDSLLIKTAQFSPDGKQIITTSGDKTSRIWDAATGRSVAILSVPGRLYGDWSAQFSPDGKWIVTASDYGTPNYEQAARVWEAATGRQVATLPGHMGGVKSAQFSPDGRWIVTVGYYDHTVRIWEAATGQVVATLRGGASSARFSPDGQRILTANGDGVARIWASAGREVATLRGHMGGIKRAQFSPDGKWILTTSGYGTGTADGSASTGDGTARVWEAATGKEVAKWRCQCSEMEAQFSSDGQWVITRSWGTLWIWEAATGRELATFSLGDLISNMLISPDGRWIVTIGNYGFPIGDSTARARVWETMTGKNVAMLRGNEVSISDAQFSPDGQWIVTIGGDKFARVWEVATGKEVATLRGHEGIVTSAQFSSDGKQIVTTSDDNTVRVWEAATGRQVATLPEMEHGYKSVRYSPDGQWLVTSKWDATAQIWAAATGKEVATLSGLKDDVMQFSPDSKYIVTTSIDKTTRLWEVATGKEVAMLHGYWGGADRLRFSPDGYWIVTEGTVAETSAQLWEAAMGKEVATLRGHVDMLTDAQFSPDGKWIITTSADGTARVYMVKIDDLIALAKTRVTRELTCEERAQYLHQDEACTTPTPLPVATFMQSPLATPGSSPLATPILSPLVTLAP
jgi:WD40 repeat protein